MLLGVNSSITDLRHSLKLMVGIREGDEVTVLMRPLCHVTFWSDVDFKGDNVELLSCEPKEQFNIVQECDYICSLIGGICPYAIDTRDFKWKEKGDGSDGPLRYLSPEEVTTLNSLIGPRVANAARHQLHLLGGEGTEKFVMYAPVKPHQALRISQRSILCGSYTLRTTELKFDYGTLVLWRSVITTE
ncbi:hypothetical protein AAVH_09686 [Aphelenchoides avenae]|nr:hypothetical protein AAVH_09686 [Aphelenchus avenae]